MRQRNGTNCGARPQEFDRAIVVVVVVLGAGMTKRHVATLVARHAQQPSSDVIAGIVNKRHRA